MPPSLAQEASILVAAGLTNRIMGFIYRFFMVRVVGAEGVGLYEMAFPVFTLFLVLATSGIPVAVARLVAERDAMGQPLEARKCFRVAMILLGVTGTMMVAILWTIRPWLAAHVFSDPRVYWPFTATVPALLVVAISSTLRGYYQGLKRLTPGAVGQVIEQVTRVVLGLGMAKAFLPRGVEMGAMGLALGMLAGEVTGMIFLVVYDRLKRFQAPWESKIINRENLIMARKLYTLSWPLAVARIITSVEMTIQTIIIPGRLQDAGYSMAHATALFGQYSGMALMLIGLPSIFTYSLASTLVPAITEAQARNNHRLLRSRTHQALRLTITIGFPAAVIFFLLGEPLSQILFLSPQVAIPLRVLSLGCTLFYLNQTTTGILYGLGRMDLTLRNSMVGSVIILAGTYTLTAIPSLGIKGPALAVVAAASVITVLNYQGIRKITGLTFDPGDLLFKPLVAAFFMAGTVQITYSKGWAGALSTPMATFTALVAGFLAYLLALVLTGALRREDWRRLPWVGHLIK